MFFSISSRPVGNKSSWSKLTVSNEYCRYNNHIFLHHYLVADVYIHSIIWFLIHFTSISINHYGINMKTLLEGPCCSEQWLCHLHLMLLTQKVKVLLIQDLETCHVTGTWPYNYWNINSHCKNQTLASIKKLQAIFSLLMSQLMRLLHGNKIGNAV